MENTRDIEATPIDIDTQFQGFSAVLRELKSEENQNVIDASIKIDADRRDVLRVHEDTNEIYSTDIFTFLSG